MKNTLTVIIVFLFAYGHVGATEELNSFFMKYIELNDNFDISVAKLYSDKAKIHAYRVYPHGTQRSLELNGEKWKQLIVRAMPIAKTKNDKSSFSNIVITKQDKKYKIKANRYSNIKCYTDTGYYMIVEESKGGDLYIIEEYMEAQPNSNC